MEETAGVNFLRWTPGDIKCLIDLYEKNICRFETFAKNKVWEEIAAEMKQIREKDFTGERCVGKWKGLKVIYKKVKDHNSTSGNSRKDWEYFDAMDDILRKRPEINPPATCSSDESVVLINEDIHAKDYNFDDIIIDETSKSSALNRPAASRKRKVDEVETARMKRHEEKMVRADKFLNLFETLVNSLAK